MSTPFAWGWYLLRLLLYPVRVAFYVLHGLLLFMSKPGARTLVPAAAAIALWAFWSPLSLLAEPLVSAAMPALRPLLGPELYAAVYPSRLLLAAAFALVAGTLILSALSEALKPLLGSFPAPARPLLPHPPLVPPRVKVKTVPVHIAARRRSGRGLDGNWKALVRRMPPDVRALLEREPQPAGRYPGPVEVTETAPLWPPLGLQAAPAAPSQPGPEGPNATPPKATRGRAAKAAPPPKRTSARGAASTKGEPPVPPPPKRTRKVAAE